MHARDHNSATTSQRHGQWSVIGVFPDRASAERAYDALMRRGYHASDVDVLISTRTRAAAFGAPAAHDTALARKAREDLGADAAPGGTLHAIATAIASVGTTIALPGLGLAVAGPIASALAGTDAPADGGMRGEPSHVDEAGTARCGIRIAVNARSDEDAARIEEEWRASRGEQRYR